MSYIVTCYIFTLGEIGGSKSKSIYCNLARACTHILLRYKPFPLPTFGC